MTQSETDSHLIAFRVNTSLYEWIKRQAIPTESPGKTVQRLIKALAADHKEKLVNDFSTVEFSQADLDAIDKMRTLIQDLVSQKHN
jgi:hypothetical protein